MLSSHEVCPICHREMKHAKYLNKECQALGGRRISFLESICNLVTDEEQEYPRHTFFQVTTLYGERLMEKIQFPFDSIEVEVNYHKSQSIITYLPKSDPYAPPVAQVDKIEMKRLLSLDYPKLDKVIQKAKTLALFL
jgi:hypothetical protein